MCRLLPKMFFVWRHEKYLHRHRLVPTLISSVSCRARSALAKRMSKHRWACLRYDEWCYRSHCLSKQELGFINRYRMRRRTLARFLLMVQKGYRVVPYHNWSHAFAVAHFCFILLRMSSVKSSLTELERLSLLVACLCHDIDHRGTTNAFQLQSVRRCCELNWGR